MIELRKVTRYGSQWWDFHTNQKPSVTEVIEWLIEHEAVSVVPWCAAHDERWAGTKCFHAMRLQGRAMPCRLEEPARHWTIGDK